MQAAPLPSPAKRLWITILAMAATLMQVLDTTIANVALPHMQASLGATQDSIAWVLTSYIVAAAIATPMTGWLESRFGRRPLFTVAIVGFTASSMACGLAPSLAAMVAARVLQGVFGAWIGPLAQATMLDIYPREGQAKAMTIWGLGIMIGPVLGPVTGGWLTDWMDWRWVFFINVPFGVAVTFGLLALLDKTQSARRRFDLAGFTLLALALAAFQLLLDRGTQLDWFDSTEIVIEAIVAVSALWAFVVHTLSSDAPILPRALFRDRNLMFANLFMLVTSGVILAGAVLVTPMLQRMLGYGTIEAGLLVAPRGLAMAAAMIVAGRLSSRFDPRLFIGAGFLITAWSLHMMTGFSLQMDARPVILSGIVQGLGVGMIVLPLNVIAFSTLKSHLRTDATSLYGLARSIGGSIAISVMTALVARNVQVAHGDMAGHVTATTMPFLNGGLIEQFGLRAEAVAMMVDGEINRQALMIAYIDDYWLMGWVALSIAPLVLFMRPPRAGEKAVMLAE